MIRRCWRANIRPARTVPVFRRYCQQNVAGGGVLWARAGVLGGAILAAAQAAVLWGSVREQDNCFFSGTTPLWRLALAAVYASVGGYPPKCCGAWRACDAVPRRGSLAGSVCAAQPCAVRYLSTPEGRIRSGRDSEFRAHVPGVLTFMQRTIAPKCAYSLHGREVCDIIYRRLRFMQCILPDLSACGQSAGGSATPKISDQTLSEDATNPELILSTNDGCIAPVCAGTNVPVRHWIESLDETLNHDRSA